MALKYIKPTPYKQSARRRRIDEQNAAKTAFGNEMSSLQGMKGQVSQNFYEDFENPYEDLTVDTRAQELAGNQYAQSMANMSGAMDPSNVGQFLRGAAGQAAGMRAQTAQMQMQNQRMAAQGAMTQQQTVMGGAEAATSRELSFQETQLGMAAGRKTAADQARQANTEMWMGMAGSALGAVPGIVDASDRKLKKNISKTGESPSGLNIYSFEYKDSKFGTGLFQGVMSDETPNYAVINNGEYDMVDYSMIDVQFKQL